MQRMVAIRKQVDKRLPRHLREKRNELMWALAFQDYQFVSIALIFNMNRSSVLRVIRKMPRDWKPKWVKAQE